jgi:UDP-N-acetyl-D-mannosaminuronic acid dehydrogenase
MRAVVVALGKIGLPIAAKLALAGHEVVGCDIDVRVVECVNAAQEPFPGELGLQEALAALVPKGSLRASTDTTAEVARGADLVIAVPPLIVDDQARPDFGILDAVTADIARALQPGTVVSVETTLPVGTTRNRIAPRLAELSGLTSEEDFHTVHSPERVYSGRIFADLDTYPKLVGGLTTIGEQRAVELYQSFLEAEVWAMGCAEAAELTKLAETTYRDVNIALANEFAQHADRVGVDIHKVIDAANSQPFSHLHRPGIAVGGHCIPVYPRFYLAGDPEARLPAVARQINESMPAYALNLLAQTLNGLAGRRVLILGVAYRGGVKETAFSGAFRLHHELERHGATALASDPIYTAIELESLGFQPWFAPDPMDAAIIQADHRVYATLTPQELPGIQAIIDGRTILKEGPWQDAGIPIIRIGQPTPVGGGSPPRAVQQPGATATRGPTAESVPFSV